MRTFAFPPLARPVNRLLSPLAWLFTAMMLAASVSAQTITSAVPNLISYQGRVSNSTGSLVGAGTPVNRTVTFRIWGHQNNSTVNDLLYSEQQTVTISEGEFSVLIGQGTAVTGTPLGYSETAKGPSTVTLASTNVFGGALRYLGVTIDDGTTAADPEVSPRQQLVTSAYAMRAKFAESVGSNGNSTLTVTDAGNVGIGQSSPGFPLNFASTLGDKISLFGVSGNSYGFGIQSALLQIHSDTINADVAFGYGSSASMTETMRIKGTGNVGIGTNNPSSKLDVNGNLNVFDGGTKTYPAGIASESSSQAISFGINDTRFGTQTLNKAGGFLLIDSRGTTTSDPLFKFQTRAAGAASAQTSMVIAASGNVGIGQSSPGFPLNFASTLGDKISLFGVSGNSYGFGIQLGLLQIHSDTINTDVAFGYGSSASMTETMRIKGTGNVGIGTSTPSAKLHVVGNARIEGSVYGSTALQSGGPVTTHTQGAYLEWNKDGTGYTSLLNQKGSGAGGMSFGEVDTANTVTERMRIDSSGNVGIGTSTPGAKLHVAGGVKIDAANTIEFGAGVSGKGVDAGKIARIYDRLGIGTSSPRVPFEIASNVAFTSGPQRYFKSDQSLTTTSSTVSDNTSILASNWITSAQGFLAYSDARIKTVVGRSLGSRDLQTLLGIEVTDYRHKDTVLYGDRISKKVVAQQLERIFPEAVTRSTDVVTDIFLVAPVNAGWVELATDLKKGERVKVISENDEKIVTEVLEVAPGRFRTERLPEGNKVFVYGREVDDFRSVDYEAIAMLNVSATQEIKREKDAEIAALSKRVAELEAKDRARDAKFASIEKLLNASQTVMAAPAKTTAGNNGQE
ncbi:MAG: tail fiber domain-containing protein [Opitutaceae bacterium]|nr:tail fiber domain-containing protein [Opitutaceae bacterium]